jgi:hypothetical protein
MASAEALRQCQDVGIEAIICRRAIPGPDSRRGVAVGAL